MKRENEKETHRNGRDIAMAAVVLGRKKCVVLLSKRFHAFSEKMNKKKCQKCHICAASRSQTNGGNLE